MKGALAVDRKELRQIARDRRTLLILVFIPVFFLLLYGYALNFDIRHIALAVEDRDGTPESRALVSAFINSGYFDLAAAVYSPADAERLLDLNDARAVLVIPEGFGRDVATRRGATVQVLISGDNANTATTVMGYALSIVRDVSALAPGGVSIAPPLTVEPRIWYNPELRSTLFLVPGLIAYIAMITAVASTALSIVREKEMRDDGAGADGADRHVRLRRRQDHSVFPDFADLGGADHPRGDGAVRAADARQLGARCCVALSLFLVGALATGLLISTVADTQQVAFQMALLISLLPTLILSGFIFPDLEHAAGAPARHQSSCRPATS